MAFHEFDCYLPNPTSMWRVWRIEIPINSFIFCGFDYILIVTIKEIVNILLFVPEVVPSDILQQVTERSAKLRFPCDVVSGTNELYLCKIFQINKGPTLSFPSIYTIDCFRLIIYDSTLYFTRLERESCLKTYFQEMFLHESY